MDATYPGCARNLNPEWTAANATYVPPSCSALRGMSGFGDKRGSAQDAESPGLAVGCAASRHGHWKAYAALSLRENQPSHGPSVRDWHLFVDGHREHSAARLEEALASFDWGRYGLRAACAPGHEDDRAAGPRAAVGRRLVDSTLGTVIINVCPSKSRLPSKALALSYQVR